MAGSRIPVIRELHYTTAQILPISLMEIRGRSWDGGGGGGGGRGGRAAVAPAQLAGHDDHVGIGGGDGG